MPYTITTITTPMMLNISVNCYLIRTDDGFILIDTGRANRRATIENELQRAGCQPGHLNLIVLTHGDFDHCGNAAYLRQKFGTRIALHPDDAGMVEHGDMFWNRNKPNAIVKTIMGLFFNLAQSDRFTPDVTLAEGDDLSAYGSDAQVICLPGHSRGSVGLLTAAGDLFCGDLLGNTKKPDLWTMIDDIAAAKASVEKLKDLDVRTVYPGHGKPFSMQQLVLDLSRNTV